MGPSKAPTDGAVSLCGSVPSNFLSSESWPSDWTVVFNTTSLQDQPEVSVKGKRLWGPSRYTVKAAERDLRAMTYRISGLRDREAVKELETLRGELRCQKHRKGIELVLATALDMVEECTKSLFGEGVV